MLENPALAVCVEHKGKIINAALVHIASPPEEFIPSAGFQVNSAGMPFAAEGLLMYKSIIGGKEPLPPKASIRETVSPYGNDSSKQTAAP
jgi:hypothetical protein